ncbi:hypothetical protein LZ31DRAFT_557278 [Colletotrichum somersetense]|nr:hypothetical protein LZ31DRAFT_557278 [Colletotrichum somersetense]
MAHTAQSSWWPACLPACLSLNFLSASCNRLISVAPIKHDCREEIGQERKWNRSVHPFLRAGNNHGLAARLSRWLSPNPSDTVEA